MTDRLSLANALAAAKIDRPVAERIATEIFEAIHDSVATKADLERLEAANKVEFQRLGVELQRLEAVYKADLQAAIAGLRGDMLLRLAELEHRLTIRFASVMVVLIGLLFAALRYLPPAR